MLLGANPDIVDASITNLIETAVNSVPGIEHIQSTSSPGSSNVVITFNLEKRIDVAFQEVQAKVNQVVRRRQLPQGCGAIGAVQDSGFIQVVWDGHEELAQYKD